MAGGKCSLHKPPFGPPPDSLGKLNQLMSKESSPPPSDPSSSSPLANPFSSLIAQSISTVPSFTLESGLALQDVPVAYKTWGRLNAAGTNCLVICHALTGSADVEDWWGPLLGLDRAFDPSRWFIFCGNVIGSPYGTASSVTRNPETGKLFGPEMPGSTVKDDVRWVLSWTDVLSNTSDVGQA